MTISVAISPALDQRVMPRDFEALPGRGALRRMAILSQTAAHLLEGRDPDREVLPALYDALSSELSVDATLGYVVTDVHKGLCLGFVKGLDLAVVERILRLDFGQAICGHVAATGKAVHATDIQNGNDPRAELVKGIGITAYACQPLLVRRGVIGTLSFASRTRTHFDPEDLLFFEAVARHVAMARDRSLQAAAASNNRELRHRVRSLLSNIQSVAGISARCALSVDSFAEALGERIAAMSSAQELIGRAGYQGVSLRELILCQVGCYSMDQLTLEGQETPITSEIAIPLAMALHELATNSLRFGALSRSSGRLHLRWRTRGTGQTARLLLQWLERDGPPVAAQPRSGFGSQLLDTMLGRRFTVERDYAPEGLSARIQVALETA